MFGFFKINDLNNSLQLHNHNLASMARYYKQTCSLFWDLTYTFNMVVFVSKKVCGFLTILTLLLFLSNPMNMHLLNYVCLLSV